MRRIGPRRIDRLYGPALNQLYEEMHAGERERDRQRTQRAFRALAFLLASMPRSALPPLQQVIGALPKRLQDIVYEVHRLCWGDTDTVEPERRVPSPCSWEDELGLHDWEVAQDG